MAGHIGIIHRQKNGPLLKSRGCLLERMKVWKIIKLARAERSNTMS